MIKLAIFDMAGTAVDEDNIVYKTVLKSLELYGYNLPLEKVLRFGAGKEKRTAITDVLKVVTDSETDEIEIDRIFETFQQLLNVAYEEAEMRLFPGAKSLMEYCRKNDIKIAFNTGYSEVVALGILNKIGISIGVDIDYLATADMVKNGRPAPDMIALICDQLGVNPLLSIKMGDSGIDIQEGRNAGVKYTIGVTTGAQDRAVLAHSNPDFIVDDLGDVIAILEKENEL